MKEGEIPVWICKLMELCNGGHEEAALKEISLVTTKFKASGEFALLSDDLSRCYITKLSDVLLVALLRNTYSIRAQILSWNSLLERTEKILQQRNREPRALLRGLKKFDSREEKHKPAKAGQRIIGITHKNGHRPNGSGR
jgi:hypothetical protein